MLIVQAKHLAQATNFSDPEIQTLRKQVSTLETLKLNIVRDNDFLDSLQFRRQPERHNLIPKAHEQTFSWIWDQSSTNTKAGRLRRWLEQTEAGIFWVSGKPGSGKSTFMKFVADNEETKRILSTWADGRKLIVASHYFWWSGTELQKSQEGLLRTLIYSILQQLPDLIRITREDIWARGFEETRSRSKASWTLEELHSVVKTIANQRDLRARFCFFIDGLDEYDGDHKEICDILKDLAGVNSGIKICLSSRPWNVFEQALGNKPGRIHIHDLTREDMRNFAQSRLFQHPQWRTIVLTTPGVRGLVNEVIERAQGVFLWVFLVTRLLCEGLDNGDSLSDLRRRLETFPSDLERFFKDILERVDSFYHGKVSTVLQIVLAAEEPLDVSIYAFHEEEFENMDYAINKPVGVLSDEAVKERRRVMAQRLNGWSKGLVEVRNQEVHFLHRTVVDFLKTREMEDFVAQKLLSWFCISHSLLKAHLAWIKTSKLRVSLSFPGPRSANTTSLELRVEEALSWAFEIETTLPASSSVHVAADALLDDMEHSIETLYTSANVGFMVDGETQRMKHFRESVLQSHLAGYLSRKLLVSPDYFQDLSKPALSVLLEGHLMRATKASWPKGWTDTLRCLLAAGQDPNQEYRELYGSDRDFTPWTNFLSITIVWNHLGDCAKTCGWFDSTIHNGLFSFFLEHGADPHALIFRTGGDHPVFSTAWVDMLLMSFEFSVDRLDEDVYLQELNAFFRHGAKIDAAAKTTVISNEFIGNGKLAYEAFFSQLTARIKSGECNINLLEQVTRILLSNMQGSKIKLDWALEQVDTALGPAIAQQLRNEFEARGNSVANRCEKRKKRRGGKPSRGRSKRQRMSK